ncbi:hypothetical protein HXX76_012089 [Chlamydomonas incerta]|uniref:Uncharacterized protein n=1 Tax=Chlamydomonas incerta TaxID=51695 RepID=A0A835SIS0_CHLIN|nr:hypothetical protein HXX76_012089 [Chlamydomonas incerta]|eukprot:KAG2427764.1 hypothetical protein HXX76_012089 [Chlamydomonas incerta]
MLGASLGVAVFFVWDKVVPFQFDTDYYLRLLTAPMVGAIGLFLGHALRMEGAGKLVPMTYLLVVVNNVEEGPAESYAVYRFLGIVVGMLIAQVTATCVFQRSAAEDVLDRLRSSLTELAELNRLVWGNQKKLAALEFGGDEAEEEEGEAPRPSEEQQLEGFQARINAALNGALASLPLTATERRVIGGPLAAWWFVPWPRSCGGAAGCCGARGWQLDQGLVSRTVGCIRRVNRLQCSFWLLLSHPPADPVIRHDPALVQLLKDFRFLTQAVVDGVLAAATHLRGVDADALVHLNSKILDSPRLVAIGGPGGGYGYGYGGAAGGGGGGSSSGLGAAAAGFLGLGVGGSSTAGSSGAGASVSSGQLGGMMGSAALLATAGSGPGGGIAAPALTPAAVKGRRPSRSPSPAPSPAPASVASAAAAVAAAAMASVASAVRVGGGGGGGGGGGAKAGANQLSEPLLPAGAGDSSQAPAPAAPRSHTPFGSLQSVGLGVHTSADQDHVVLVAPPPGGGGGGGALVMGGPSALDEEEGKDDDASSVFHRPPLQYMPTGLASFERSVLTPEVWWHTFQFLLTQLAAEVSAMQEAVSQLVRVVKP